jgi:hypothetical protein
MPRMLNEVLAITGDYSITPGNKGHVYVYVTDYTRSSYYGLADYVVSSAVSASALILVPRRVG